MTKRTLWEVMGRSRSENRSTSRTGFLEKVPLPSFSGVLGEYPDFKGQFRELAQSDGYTNVIELAQLK